MILIDTSVWIDYFNGTDNQYTDALDKALEQGIAATGDIIYLEVLQGFRQEKDFNQAKKALKTLDTYTLLGPEMPDKCAEQYRQLRKKGITVRKTIDVIIATFCIEHKMPLLYLDKDFHPFVKHADLKPALRAEWL